MLALAPVRPVVARVNSALNAKVRRCLTPRPDFGDNYDAAFATDPDGSGSVLRRRLTPDPNRTMVWPEAAASHRAACG